MISSVHVFATLLGGAKLEACDKLNKMSPHTCIESMYTPTVKCLVPQPVRPRDGKLDTSRSPKS